MIERALAGKASHPDAPRLLHGFAALLVLLGAVLILIFFTQLLISPVAGKSSSLKAANERVATLTRALEDQQSSLSGKLQLIGETPEALNGLLANPVVREQLNADANFLTADLVSMDLTATGRSPIAETALTDRLSAYSLTLNYSGNSAALTRLASRPVNSDVRIARIEISGDDEDGDGALLQLLIELRRIGPASPQSGDTQIDQPSDE